jgi:hypothetical protein
LPPARSGSQGGKVEVHLFAPKGHGDELIAGQLALAKEHRHVGSSWRTAKEGVETVHFKHGGAKATVPKHNNKQTEKEVPH